MAGTLSPRREQAGSRPRYASRVAVSPAFPHARTGRYFPHTEEGSSRPVGGTSRQAVSRLPGVAATVNSPHAGTAYQRAKRLLDIVGAGVGLVFLTPILLLVAVLVLLDSPGPVLHRRRVLARQPWTGQATTEDLETFDALKFRTMRADADAYLARNPALWAAFQQDFKLTDDPRVTRLGRFLRRTSIDELPQLWNVLVGQMTLVGPRIITPEELDRYGEHAPSLLSVTPGLTGLWQVSGRATTGYRERVRLDIAYIESRSAALDLDILRRTVRCVLAGSGAV